MSHAPGNMTIVLDVLGSDLSARETARIVATAATNALDKHAERVIIVNIIGGDDT